MVFGPVGALYSKGFLGLLFLAYARNRMEGKAACVENGISQSRKERVAARASILRQPILGFCECSARGGILARIRLVLIFHPYRKS